MKNINLLVIEDDRRFTDGLKIAFKNKYKIIVASNRAEAIKSLNNYRIDIVLLDLRLPPHPEDESEGEKILSFINTKFKNILTIIITGIKDDKVKINFIKRGVYDFLEKPININALKIILERAVSRIKLQRKIESLEKKIKAKEEDMLDNIIIGESESMKRIKETIRSISNMNLGDIVILITGETGTGKQLVAEMIHKLSNRRAAPFITVNCASIPQQLFESEFFGYKKGAFTGAYKDYEGLFLKANKGTIFLDEFTEIPLDVQAKLLRVIEYRKLKPIGATTEKDIDVLIIVATNKPLEELKNSQILRKDFYYRVSQITITIPPLRERKEDIPLLIDHYLGKYNKQYQRKKILSKETNELFLKYHWPGNVREIQNLIRKIMILKEDYITPSLLEFESAFVYQDINGSDILNKLKVYFNKVFIEDPEKLKYKNVLEIVKNELFNFVYNKSNKNISATARILNVSRNTVIDWLNSRGKN